MASLTPINSLRKPDQTDAPLGGLQISALADDVDSRLVARFATTAERDQKIPNPRQGQVCHIDAQTNPVLPSRLMVFSESRWRLVGPSPLRAVVAPWTEPEGQFGLGAGGATLLTSLTVPDPGFPYRLSAIAHCNLGTAPGVTGTRWDLYMVATGGGISTFTMDYFIPSLEAPISQRIVTNVTDQIFTGQCTVRLEARRAFGTANGFIDDANRRFHVNQHAA